MKKQRNIPIELEGKTFLDPKYDPAFQELFSEKDTLKHFLNGILHLEGSDAIQDLEYRTPDIRFGLPDPKLVRFDVLAQCQSGELVNIEMQRAKHSFFKDRAILYGAMLAIQAKKNLERNNVNENKDLLGNFRYQMPKVISVWICNFKLESNSIEYHDEWSVYSKQSLKQGIILPVSNVLKYIFIELPNFRKSLNELITVEDKWLYALKNMGDEEESPSINDSIVQKAYDRLRVHTNPLEILSKQVENMLTEAEIEERLWENAQKGLQQGLEQGRQQGRKEGHQDGKLEQAHKMAKAMREDGISTARIAAYSGLTEKEILAL